MTIDNIEEWVKANAGRKVSVKGTMMTGNLEAIVVGYQVRTYSDGKTEASRIILNGASQHVYENPDGNNFVFVDVTKLANKKFGWHYPAAIIELLPGMPVKAVSSSKKIINEWPHECPRCGGPAYIGFLTTVDCQRKCP